jgi:hypothetical protein
MALNGLCLNPEKSKAITISLQPFSTARKCSRWSKRSRSFFKQGVHMERPGQRYNSKSLQNSSPSLDLWRSLTCYNSKKADHLLRIALNSCAIFIFNIPSGDPISRHTEHWKFTQQIVQNNSINPTTLNHCPSLCFFCSFYPLLLKSICFW